MPPTNESFVALTPPARPAIAKGDRVWFIPGPEHQLATGPRGEMAFDFEHVQDYSSRKVSYKRGDRVGDFGLLGRGKWRRVGTGEYRTGGGHHVRAVGCSRPWPAIVRDIFADGTVALDVAHPNSGCLEDGHNVFERGVSITLHLPSPHVTSNGVPYSKTFAPHSFHLDTDRKAVS